MYICITNPLNILVMTNFNNIYKMKKGDISRYVALKVKNAYDREEIVSDIFIRVNKYLPRFDESKSNLTSWLINIANSSISDYFRRENKIRANTFHVSDYVNEEGDEYFQVTGSFFADSLTISSEQGEVIQNAFNALKPKYREVAEMFFVENLQYGVIAETLNMPIGSVKGMINRARAMLSESLKRYALV